MIELKAPVSWGHTRISTAIRNRLYGFSKVWHPSNQSEDIERIWETLYEGLPGTGPFRDIIWLMQGTWEELK